MQRILPAYIVREHIGPFVLALVVIKFLFVLNILYRDLGKFLSKGIAFPVIMEFLFLNLAWMIALAVPMAVLTATIMAFGRLSADNEIVAMKASGISLLHIFGVLLVLSALLAGFLVWFNNAVLPDFNHRARVLMQDIGRKKPMINLEPGIIYSDIPNFNILIQSRKDEKHDFGVLTPETREPQVVTLVEKIIIDDERESGLRKTITAREGEIRFHKQSGLLEITLFDGEIHEVNIHELDIFRRLEFPKHVIKIPLSEMLLIRSNSNTRSDREMSAAALWETVEKKRAEIAEREARINQKVDVWLAKLNKPRNQNQRLIGNVVREYQQFKRQLQIDFDTINSFERTKDRYLVEYYKKYSIPAICVVFVLIGMPLGIMIRARGWAVAAVLSLVFFLIFWAFLIGGEVFADRQIVSPFWAMWSPNVIVGIFGIYLVLKVFKER